MSVNVHWSEVPLIAALCLSCCGCGGGDGKTADVHGKATFLGAAIPTGRIDFVPAADQGGSPGYATIVNGEFATKSNGRGVNAGKINARVSGFDGKSQPSEELLYGKPLFKPYATTIELSAGDQQIDIDVPKGR